MKRLLGLMLVMGMVGCGGGEPSPKSSQAKTNGPRTAARVETGERVSPPWGQMQDGLSTRITLIASTPVVGRPLMVRLEMRNTSTVSRAYDDQQIAVNNPLDVHMPDGQRARYIGSDFQTVGDVKTIKPNETVTLLGELDVTKQYLLSRAGEYKIRLRGQTMAAGVSRIPASNMIVTKLAAGVLKPLQQTLTRLLPTVRSGWRLSISGDVILVQQTPRADKRHVVAVQLWFTDERLPEGTQLGTPPNELQVHHLGTTPLGYGNLTATEQARKRWPGLIREIQKCITSTPDGHEPTTN